jgi:hypothetical protein
MLQCSRCIERHGAPGCPATLEDLDGKPSCAWCIDLEPCPVEQRRLKAAKKKPPEEPPAASDVNSEKPASEQESEVNVPKTLETDANIAPKICKRPGCTIELSSRNEVGLCRSHVRWTAPGERAASSAAPTNGHAHAHAHAPGNGNGVGNGANGVHKAGNGHARADREAPANGSNGAAAAGSNLDPDRVDQLLATLSAQDKSKLALAWLTRAL